MDDSPPWSVDGRGRVTVSVGDFPDRTIDDVMMTFGAGFADQVGSLPAPFGKAVQTS